MVAGYDCVAEDDDEGGEGGLEDGPGWLVSESNGLKVLEKR